MNKAYIISLATAGALGYLSGFASNGLVAKAGQERPAQAMVQKSYQTSLPAVAGIWNQIRTVGCADADTLLEMDAGTCAAQMVPCSVGTVMSMTCMPDGKTDVAMNFAFNGFWTPGAPQ